jgi:NAD(P)-dependent dehydrogenase (short-subunit alcohol dehydrogenase family)
MKDLDGRVAFVTGGASGIGLGMARAFLDAGMTVVIADRDAAYLAEARQRLSDAGPRLRAMVMDVTDRAAMRAAAAETVGHFGAVHLLCNNAGVTASVAIEDAGHAEWDFVMGVNVQGVVNGLVEFLPAMKMHRQGGHIVNTASMAAIVPSPGRTGIYGASKFAVRGITEALRPSLAPYGIGVSLLCPGMVDTRILESSNKYRKDAAEPTAALAGSMDPMEVGRQVAAGVRANRPYIFTHEGWRDEVREVFDGIVEALPEGPPAQDGFNVRRRALLAERRALADSLS